MVSGGVILALVLGRLEPVLVILPFMVVLGLAAVAVRIRPELELAITVDKNKTLEGDEVEIAVALATLSGNFIVTFLMDPIAGIRIIDQPPSISVRADSPVSIRGRVECIRWGAHFLGGGQLQARDQLSAFVYERSIKPSIPIRTFPRPETLRSMLKPHMLRQRFGSLASRSAGAGLEFADIREFSAGDQRRHINWKATARHGRAHVNLFHPEWSSDIVLIVDTFRDVIGDTRSSLDLEVAATVSAALESLQRRDRVGLLTVGGTIRWLLAGMGMRQFYRIVDSLMQTQLAFSHTWPQLEAIPRRAIPPRALLIALTPLVDRRMSTILLDLRARGHDVVIVEIPAEALLPPSTSDREQLARRLWRLHRNSIRSHYLQAGLPVADWELGRPLQIPFRELERSRRTSQRVRA